MLTPCHGTETIAGGCCTSQPTPQPHPGVSWLQEVARAGPGSCTRNPWQSRDEIWTSLSCGLLWSKCQGLGVGERKEKGEKGDYVHMILNASDVKGEF